MKKLSQSGVRSLKAPRMRGIVGVAGTAFEQGFGFLAAVAAEVGVQQVDHGPQVAAFLDVDLEQVAHVIERGAGQAEVALLLDRGRLGVALGHDQAAQVAAVFARHFLPGGLALVRAEIHLAAFLGRVEEDAPAVVGHLDVVEMGPAGRVDADRGAQVDVEVLRAVGAHVLPPVDELGLPVLQRALQGLVVVEVDVVGDLLAVIDAHGALLSGVGGLLLSGLSGRVRRVPS
jgi:hypothetical protein